MAQESISKADELDSDEDIVDYTNEQPLNYENNLDIEAIIAGFAGKGELAEEDDEELTMQLQQLLAYQQHQQRANMAAMQRGEPIDEAQFMAAAEEDEDEAEQMFHFQQLMRQNQLLLQGMGDEKEWMGEVVHEEEDHGEEVDPHLWMTPAEFHHYQEMLEIQKQAQLAPPQAEVPQTLAKSGTAKPASQEEMGGMDPQTPTDFGGTWSEWFCSLDGHQFLSLVPRSFACDKMQWLGMRAILKLSTERYQEAQALSLSMQAPRAQDLENEEFLQVNQDASDMYGLLHNRYMSSAEGLAVLYGKFLKGEYGHCPRALCDNMAVLPVGMNDCLRRSRVKVFCPKCEEVYVPNLSLDGAYFGTSIAHAFLKAYQKQITLPPAVYMYEPKLFGFKVAGKCGSAYYTPPVDGIHDTKESETDLKRKMGGNPTFDASNANKNNNNNNKTPQIAVTSQTPAQLHQQLRKHKKNES